MKRSHTQTMTKEKVSRAVVIACNAPEANSICVAGTFNEWQPGKLALQRDDVGNWAISLNLAPGHYEYKFIIDGAWCCDAGCERECEHCDKCVPNEFGTTNRVLEVD